MPGRAPKETFNPAAGVVYGDPYLVRDSKGRQVLRVDNPFASRPSGSHWRWAHLNWLHVDLYEDEQVPDLVPKRLPEPHPIRENLKALLGRSITSIERDAQRQPKSGFYFKLYMLLHPPKRSQPYINSSSPLAPSTPGR